MTLYLILESKFILLRKMNYFSFFDFYDEKCITVFYVLFVNNFDLFTRICSKSS